MVFMFIHVLALRAAARFSLKARSLQSIPKWDLSAPNEGAVHGDGGDNEGEERVKGEKKANVKASRLISSPKNKARGT